VTTYDAELAEARVKYDLAVAGPKAAIRAATAARAAALREADKILDGAWVLYKLAVAEPEKALRAAWDRFTPFSLKAAQAAARRGPAGGP
jgi:hypothetical protein